MSKKTRERKANHPVRNYFHVCRVPNRLQPGQIIELLQPEVTPEMKPDAWLFEKTFPRGLSQHGIEYMTRQWDSPKDQASVTLEFLAEYVRVQFFPNRPSRFISFFALESFEQALQFVQNVGPAKDDMTGAPLTVECFVVRSSSPAFRANMNLLKHERSWLQTIASLHVYWQGLDVATIWNPTSPLFPEVLLRPPIQVVEQVPLT